MIRRESYIAAYARFEEHLPKVLGEAIELTGDQYGYVRNLIADLDAVEVAKLLVDPNEVRDPPTGFRRLMEHDLARLTIEQAIVEFADSGLFTEAEVETARARLAIFRKR